MKGWLQVNEDTAAANQLCKDDPTAVHMYNSASPFGFNGTGGSTDSAPCMISPKQDAMSVDYFQVGTLLTAAGLDIDDIQQSKLCQLLVEPLLHLELAASGTRCIWNSLLLLLVAAATCRCVDTATCHCVSSTNDLIFLFLLVNLPRRHYRHSVTETMQQIALTCLCVVTDSGHSGRYRGLKIVIFIDYQNYVPMTGAHSCKPMVAPAILVVWQVS